MSTGMRTLVGSPEPAPQPVTLIWLDTSSSTDTSSVTAWTNWCPRCGLASGAHFIGCPTLASPAEWN